MFSPSSNPGPLYDAIELRLALSNEVLYIKLIPKNKMATQKQIYSAIKFLISKDSDYVVGQNLYVDGGFSSW